MAPERPGKTPNRLPNIIQIPCNQPRPYVSIRWVCMAETLTDPALWGRARDGEAGSFEELMRRYDRPVYSLAMALLGDAHAAEDVTQEAFTRAYHNLSRCPDPSRIGAWILSIARNCAREMWRARGRVQLLPEIDKEAPEDDRMERIEEVKQAISKLGEDEQVLLAMKYQSGMSCKEIAAHTGMSLSNVKVSLFRAYEELRKQVKP